MGSAAFGTRSQLEGLSWLSFVEESLELLDFPSTITTRLDLVTTTEVDVAFTRPCSAHSTGVGFANGTVAIIFPVQVEVHASAKAGPMVTTPEDGFVFVPRLLALEARGQGEHESRGVRRKAAHGALHLVEAANQLPRAQFDQCHGVRLLPTAVVPLAARSGLPIAQFPSPCRRSRQPARQLRGVSGGSQELRARKAQSLGC
mmetsp:Transcript_33974/g.63434  ORF Transcript_33974/g.63434 Transcript_33974/m.63434 type:complete len:202 (+) Transcript_33974:65-670(+)